MKTIEQFLSSYIGTPYSKVDCWDVTKLFYREVLDINIGFVEDYGTPGNDETYRKKISNIVEIHKSKFVEVDTLCIGDIILFKILGIPAHVGIYIGEGKFIHSVRELGCAVESLKNWNRKVEGYFRWPEQDYTH